MNMTNDETIILAFCWGVAIILFYKWIKKNNEIKKMEQGTCVCSDKTLKTTYQKNIYIYYYTYLVNKEKYTTRDETRFKFPFFNPNINDELNIYYDKLNPQQVITPWQILKHKIIFILIIMLFILPILSII